jgi:hypothetical protein
MKENQEEAPFWVRNENGNISLQIVESSLDLNNSSQVNIMAASTHFVTPWI